MSSNNLQTHQIPLYPEISLNDLDAGKTIAYPLPDGGLSYYRVPGFLIIGAQKCGTRELHTWLDAHPQLRGVPNECHFFDETFDLATEWPTYLLTNTNLIAKDEYQLSRKASLQTFEKTPGYFDKNNRNIPVPELVKKLMPSGKFIVLLRNPTARLYSAYQMGRHAQDVIGPLAECLKYDFEDFVVRCLAKDPEIDHRFLDIGHYAEHIKTWLQYFPREQLYVRTTEQLKKDPFTLMASLLQFLQLSPLDYHPMVEKNTRGFWVIKGQYSKANAKKYAPIPQNAKTLLDQYYQPWNQALQTLLPELHIDWT